MANGVRASRSLTISPNATIDGEPKPPGRRFLGDSAERRDQHALPRRRGILHDRHRQIRGRAAVHQARRDLGQPRHPHIQNDRQLRPRQRPPLQAALIARGVLAGDQDDAVVGIAGGRRDIGIGQSGDARGHAGDDAERDAGGDEAHGLLAAAAEHERIAALQAQHPQALARQFDQPLGDVPLAGRGLAAALAGKFPDHVRPGEAKHRLIDQRVVQDHLRLAERVDRMQGQQPGIARPGAGQPDLSGTEPRQAEGGDGVGDRRGHGWQFLPAPAEKKPGCGLVGERCLYRYDRAVVGRPSTPLLEPASQGVDGPACADHDGLWAHRQPNPIPRSLRHIRLGGLPPFR